VEKYSNKKPSAKNCPSGHKDPNKNESTKVRILTSILKKINSLFGCKGFYFNKVSLGLPLFNPNYLSPATPVAHANATGYFEQGYRLRQQNSEARYYKKSRVGDNKRSLPCFTK